MKQKVETMKKLVTLAVFDNVIEVKFNILKDMLEEAEIPYLTKNENARKVKPTLSMVATNIAIEVKVYEEDLEEALKIWHSIS